MSACSVVLVLVAALTPPAGTPSRPTAAEYRRLADELDAYLKRHVLAPRFPRSVDSRHGGFQVSYAADWSPQPDAERFVVFQARMVWTAATVALLRPQLRDEYRTYVRHGLRYLADVFWDREHGGFHTYVRLTGAPVEPEIKLSYGNAFAVYALAAAHRATGDPEALELARRGFDWMEKHFRTDEGYLAGVARDGSRLPFDPDSVSPPRDSMGWPSAWLSMNVHIHVLEAYTELLRASPDERVRERTESLLTLVRDRFVTDPGAMHLFLTPEGRPIPGPVSFGHDFETGFLLLEAAEALDKGGPRTGRVARKLVDHSLAFGWDPAEGRVFEEGLVLGPVIDRSLQWWSQFEAMNALLLMHERHGREGGPYWEAFLQAWRFIRERLTDDEHGGVFAGYDEHGALLRGKSNNWFAAYHTARALLLSSDRLRRLAE